MTDASEHPATAPTWTYVWDEATGTRVAVDREKFLKELAAKAAAEAAAKAAAADTAPTDETLQDQPKGTRK